MLGCLGREAKAENSNNYFIDFLIKFIPSIEE